MKAFLRKACDYYQGVPRGNQHLGWYMPPSVRSSSTANRHRCHNNNIIIITQDLYIAMESEDTEALEKCSILEVVYVQPITSA